MIVVYGIVGLALFCIVFAYIPTALLVQESLRRERARARRRRPINEVLAEALAQGRITDERFGEMIDEVHAAMGSLDRPYPLVGEWEPGP